MIKEDYCSYEVAKILKEKAFNESCYTCYVEKEIFHYDYSSTNYELIDGIISCPTIQMVMKWLREEKNIFIVIEPHAYDYINEKNKSYECSLWIGDNYYEYIESKDYPSYKEAVEAALKYCLENLI